MPSSIDVSTHSFSPSPGMAALLLYTFRGTALGLGVGMICLPWYVLKRLFELRDQEIDKKGYVLSWAKTGAGIGCVIGLCALFDSPDVNTASLAFDKRGNSPAP